MENNNYDDYDIRQPDESINEQLLEDTRNDFEKQIDEAIYLSRQEIIENQIKNTEFETKLLKEYEDETKRRKEIFKEFLFNLNKIGKFDNEIREIFNIIDPIIESYCNQVILSYEFDKETYDKIFNVINKIRMNEGIKNILQTIILREN